MPITLKQRPAVSAGAVEVISIDLTPYLDPGELVASLITPVEQTTSDLTLDSEKVSDEVLSILDDDNVEVGHAVQFRVQGQLAANSPYRIRITPTTDSTPARSPVFDILLQVK